MGVIRKLGNTAPIISFSEESLNSLGISQPATPPTEPESADEAPVIVVQRRDPSQLLQRLENHRLNQRTGARKSRRANNARVLQTLIEDETESWEPSISDFQPKTENAFTQLLNNCDNMRVWQYFITQDEKEQREYLEAVSPRHRRGDEGRVMRGFSFTQINTDVAEIDQFTETDGFTMVPAMSDCRSFHPAYVEEQRFGLIEPQLQSILKKKHLPLGVVSYLEEEIVELFSSDPSAVYITQELTSFERLLLHAVCQYNFLSSKSATIAGVRRTKVENGKTCFHVPQVPLARYVEIYFRAKQ